MSDGETIRRFNVSKPRGEGVLVLVWESDDRGIGGRRDVDERIAGTWADLAALGAEYEVPRGHWTIDDDAQEALRREPGTATS
ncbi:hypothetical protein [Streptacidiphilus sp. MAP5-3]|uniref:hypothetical protein n=1 Tax=unclassified Streptacidiphilus TaxID=2643834 RepID=UPI0035192EBD